ncbi:4Fe-4S binding protein [Thermodesulforhabdus norvegica]|uniref:4Fe-4S binding domain-containing protein n=1 Tax=Thermodesulforhabdus norvegica TaxID=39841 RepID=A0A1I4TPC6_9BACT|nr:4Fe-4S binding protein [Thermodesulforhabdus norvegica]SFM78608.1 4Fe-4S binding domain-containing protein [Thermodesulforhabdus norvegica]
MKGLKIDLEKCIGCRACSVSCTEGLISLKDADGYRVLSFPGRCPVEQCRICRDLCPTQALEVTEKLSDERVECKFPLVACKSCGSYFATLNMVEHVRKTLAHIDTAETGWILLCGACRKELSLVA